MKRRCNFHESLEVDCHANEETDRRFVDPDDTIRDTLRLIGISKVRFELKLPLVTAGSMVHEFRLIRSIGNGCGEFTNGLQSDASHDLPVLTSQTKRFQMIAIARPLVLLCGLTLMTPCVTAEGTPLNDNLNKYVAAREVEFDRIPADRKQLLAELAAYVQAQRTAQQPVRLTFICTHNSRRSHLSQIWASTAAAHYGIGDLETFSGGTEATAFNPRAVAAMRRAGFIISDPAPAENPRYQVVFAPELDPLECFSKRYNESPNPQSQYCAVMTCSDADEKCPLIQGATQRIALTYDDPKAFDGTPAEAAKYDERCAQIAREMLYVFSLVRS